MKLAALALALLGMAAQASGADVLLADVRFFGLDADLDVEVLRELIRTPAGEPLDPIQLAESLRDLADSGLFDLVEAHVDESSSGPVLTYALRPRLRVASVVISGLGRRQRSRLKTAAGLIEGEILVVDQVEEALARLLEDLRDDGWLDATADWNWTTAPGRQAQVAVQVSPGPRGRIRWIEVVGVEAADEVRLRELADLKLGDPVAQADLDEANSRIRDGLVESGRLAALSAVQVLFDRAANGDPLGRIVFDVNPGPLFEVAVDGPENFRLPPLGELLRNRQPDGSFRRRLTREIFEEFQSRGYPEPVISVELTDDRLSVVVEPGRRGRLGSVAFPGQAELSELDLLEVMKTQPGRKGRIIAETVKEDLEAIRAAYSAEGYRFAEVGPPRLEWIDDESFRLVIPVEEGSRCLVRGVEFFGIPEADAVDLLEELKLTPGSPWVESQGPDDEFQISAFYDQRGHMEVDVQFLLPDFSRDGSEVDLAWQIDVGQATTIDRVLVRGNTRTRREIIRRNSGLVTGEPLSLGRLIEARQSLIRTGHFTKVDVKSAEHGGRPSRDVVIEVAEGQAISVTWGLGFEYDSALDKELTPRGSLAVVHDNLFGTERAVGLDARISSRDRRFALNYLEPRPWGFELPTTAFLFLGREERPGPNFDVERRGLVIDTSRSLFERTGGAGRVSTGEVDGLVATWSGKVRLEHQIVDITRAPRVAFPDSPETPDLEDTISGLSIGLVGTNRDPFLPRRGFFVDLELGYSIGTTGDPDYWKFFGQGTRYKYFKHRDLTLAATVRLGAIHPTGTSTPLPNRSIPLVERFFAGGRSTHRAFPLDELGVAGQTILLEPDGGEGVWVPVGGNALLLSSVEARFPIFFGFEGAAFLDSGNVWSRLSDVDLGEVRLGAGLGLRYQTPVGPLRIDYGWKLDKEIVDEASGELSFSVGYPF